MTLNSVLRALPDKYASASISKQIPKSVAHKHTRSPRVSQGYPSQVRQFVGFSVRGNSARWLTRFLALSTLTIMYL